MNDQRAAEWFGEHWGGEHGLWMLGFVFPGCSIHNNALESTWKWLKAHTSTKQGGNRCTIQLFTVLSLRHFTDQSRMAEQNLVELGHPNEFPKEPPVTRETWRSVQMMDASYLQCIHIIKGDAKPWNAFLTHVLEAPGTTVYEKIRKGKRLRPQHLTEILFPTSYTVKKINDDNPQRRLTA